MVTYEQVKNWYKEKENKQKVVIGICFVLVFFVGFGSGRFVRQDRRSSYKPQSNYTTSAPKKPAPTANKEADAPPTIATGTVASASTTAVSANCIVKGNIGAGNKKIYHVKGGSFYNRVKPEQCFNTEAEAQAAGFIKSSR